MSHELLFFYNLQRLTSVNLSKLNGLSARALSDLVMALPGMKILNLEMTKCNDQVLSVIGKYQLELYCSKQSAIFGQKKLMFFLFLH